MNLFRAFTLLCLICGGFSFEFEKADNNEVHYDNFTDQLVVIHMDENNSKNLPVIIVTKNDSNIELFFFTGLEENFGPVIEENGDDYNIVISKSVDYEAIEDKFFYIRVSTKKIEKFFSLVIVNVDDNAPSFTTKQCTIPENTTITIENATCNFEVSDLDGFLDEMKFDIGEENMNNLFKFQYKTPPAITETKTQVYLVLQDNVILDYEDQKLYIFQLMAKDSANHSTVPTAVNQIIVNVKDLPDEKPIWTKIFYSETFDEEHEQVFHVSARDGDIGIDNTIKYKIREKNQFITIDADTGEILVAKIDRDKGYDRINFDVIAYEEQEPSSEITETITFVINDIDDNIPQIMNTGKRLEISLEENLNIPINETIEINDIDLGQNALYSVSLLERNPADKYTSAFQIVPTKGINYQVFTLIIVNETKLDYEDPHWRKFSMSIASKGDQNVSMADEILLDVILIDRNDEYPIFEHDGDFTASVREDVEMGAIIKTTTGTTKATDKDENDEVRHTLLGTVANIILAIDINEGSITTKIKNAFDYEKQKEVLIQIQAEDKAFHKVQAQLHITVLDVNDENPVIYMEPSTITLNENQKDGTPINAVITASDEDTSAVLKFDIDWNKSHAYKNSIQISEEEFKKIKGCVNVKTNYDSGTRTASAVLSIIEVNKNNTPDYETYDTLSIYVQVHDTKTEHGTGFDHVIVPINIINVNDNNPEFTEDTKTAKRSVMENANLQSVVGSVTAIDKDNLNKLIYSIKSRENSPDWIDINPDTGELFVKFNKIDCDDPARNYLYYTVYAFDGEFKSPLDINIFITDVNDNEPKMTVNIDPINENISNRSIIYQFKAVDKDRDEINNAVGYSFWKESPSTITDRFIIEKDLLKVNLISPAEFDAYIDSNYSCRVIYKDNPNNIGQIQHVMEAQFLVIINDINNRIPFVKTKSLSTRENIKKGEIPDMTIIGEDLDQPGTDNAKINFTLIKTERFNSNDEIIDEPNDLFGIKTDSEYKTKRATLVANKDLKDYYGSYNLTIQTEDFGKPIPLAKNNIVQLEVKRFNYEEPKITFPVNNQRYYLRKAQNMNSQLYLYNDEKFPNITATSGQGDKYDITFDVKFDSENDNIFSINSADSFGQSTGQLWLDTGRPLDLTKIYSFKIIATIKTDDTKLPDEESYSTDITMSIGFYDLNTDPVFSYASMSGEFTEEDEGLTEVIPLYKRAEYPNTDIQNLSIYYLLMDENDTIFNVNKSSGDIKLNEKLDYECQTSYTLHIQASRDGKINRTPERSTYIDVNIQITSEETIRMSSKMSSNYIIQPQQKLEGNSSMENVFQVKNINDNRPKFKKELYFGGIMSTYPRNVKIIDASAEDADGDAVTYSIVEGSMDIHVDGFSGTPFVINAKTGEITLNFLVQSNMRGYFVFNIQVDDPEPTHTDTVTVKVFIITENNRVNFKYANEQTVVREEIYKIEEILQGQFKYIVHIEKIEPDNIDGRDMNNQTVVTIYFVNETTNEPIERETIIKKVTDISIFSNLKQNFWKYGLDLMSFEVTNSEEKNREEVLQAWLIGVSVVLGTVCLTLLLTFILKIRALNQRIRNLSTTKFGSQESGLNRQGIPAPTTNKHAIEGSNPVYNNDTPIKEINRQSVASGDSDLIGVEDNPEFQYDDYDQKYDF